MHVLPKYYYNVSTVKSATSEINVLCSAGHIDPFSVESLINNLPQLIIYITVVFQTALVTPYSRRQNSYPVTVTRYNFIQIARIETIRDVKSLYRYEEFNRFNLGCYK